MKACTCVRCGECQYIIKYCCCCSHCHKRECICRSKEVLPDNMCRGCSNNKHRCSCFDTPPKEVPPDNVCHNCGNSKHRCSCFDRDSFALSRLTTISDTSDYVHEKNCIVPSEVNGIISVNFSRIYTRKSGNNNVTHFSITADAPLTSTASNSSAHSFYIKLDLDLPLPKYESRPLGNFSITFPCGGTPSSGIIYYNGKTFVIDGHIGAVGAIVPSVPSGGELFGQGYYISD